jgi:hypothetical protein
LISFYISFKSGNTSDSCSRSIVAMAANSAENMNFTPCIPSPDMRVVQKKKDLLRVHLSCEP